MKKIISATCLAACIALMSCSQNTDTPPESVPVATANSGISIAVVNMDSISNNYLYVEAVRNELESTQLKFQKDLESQADKFKKDYDNYLKIGATMTLSEQKAYEKQLETRQQNILNLEQQYQQQMLQLTSTRMQEVQDKIYGFIKEYNRTHQNFTLILSNAISSGAVIYSLETMNITSEILEALNEDYLKTKTKK